MIRRGETLLIIDEGRGETGRRIPDSAGEKTDAKKGDAEEEGTLEFRGLKMD